MPKKRKKRVESVSGSTRFLKEQFEEAVNARLQEDVDEATVIAKKELESMGYTFPKGLQISFDEIFTKRKKNS